MKIKYGTFSLTKIITIKLKVLKDRLEFTVIGDANPTINHKSVILRHFHSIQDVITLVYTVLTATRHAPPTVKTAHVTYKVERVLTVNQDGLE